MKKILLITGLASILLTSSFAAGGGDIFRSSLVVDQLEYQVSDEKATTWNAYGYAGYDINKVYIYTEGEKPKNESAQSENQLLYSRAISPYWDAQVGMGYDKNEGSHQTWGVLGVQGLAPYFFETKASLLIGDDGNIGLRAEAEYDALLTQKLILSPSIALSAYSSKALFSLSLLCNTRWKQGSLERVSRCWLRFGLNHRRGLFPKTHTSFFPAYY
mgnify:CR=1 FL=1